MTLTSQGRTKIPVSVCLGEGFFAKHFLYNMSIIFFLLDLHFLVPTPMSIEQFQVMLLLIKQLSAEIARRRVFYVTLNSPSFRQPAQKNDRKFKIRITFARGSRILTHKVPKSSKWSWSQIDWQIFIDPRGVRATQQFKSNFVWWGVFGVFYSSVFINRLERRRDSQ